MLTFLLITGAVLCCGLCMYGISKGIQRSKIRLERDARVLVQHH